MQENYKFVQCENGVYFTRISEDKTISSDAYKVKDEDIVNLFLDYLKRYCINNNKDILEIVNNNNETVMESKLYVSAFN